MEITNKLEKVIFDRMVVKSRRMNFVAHATGPALAS